MKIQKEKDQIEISLNNKIEILQYKLLNGTKDGYKNGDGDKNNVAENTFKELLVLCKGEIADLKKKIAMLQQNDKVEDNLRSEIIDQGRKMNELRSEHEQQMYDLKQQNQDKIDELQLKHDGDMRKMGQRLKEELAAKNDKIKEMDRQQQKDKILREKAESALRQMDDLKEVQKNLAVDRDIINQEKEILQERTSALNEDLVNLKDQMNAYSKSKI